MLRAVISSRQIELFQVAKKKDKLSKKSCSCLIFPSFVLTRVTPSIAAFFIEASIPKNSPVCVPLKFQC